ncbi:4a-hydroxytetrahydrobiopterin dehydratase [Herbiconiux sp. CPCC 205763]|uniref:Putative pterin-4-alpha-carbinolamine dehydratase n=1 Tax=Herbiconiux aconitum TaxID=2970913 RepID=A0ABT2GJX1_9MICO|nr:VOC family protein [Herbiconiux aconitum]MCS5716515.1 4a-hydroxytetrahydrobiopterin dehydratase [Herbiconiux aconitum]
MEETKNDRISPREFRAAEGVSDWRVVFDGARAHFATGSFEKGAALVFAIAELSDAAGHHPDVELQYATVAVRLISHDIGDISHRDLALARRISIAADELGIVADPSRVQTVQIAVDALDIPAVMPFWEAVLGYRQEGGEDVVDPLGHGPNVWFQQMDVPRPQRNRIHIDVSVPRDEAERRVAAAVAAGGKIVNDAYAPAYWTLADLEGNEVDVAAWRDDSD